MAYVTGVLLAMAILLFATAVGFDRSRSFYPTILVVIASYYGLFAVMSGSTGVLLVESGVIAAFVFLSTAGFRLNLWLVVGGLAAHGIFDSVHGRLIHNPGVPTWWPMFCLTFDVTVGGYMAWRLYRRFPVTRAEG